MEQANKTHLLVYFLEISFVNGHRLEIYCVPEIADRIIQTSESFGIEAAVIGRTEPKLSDGNSNTLTIHNQDKTLNYKI